MQLKLTFSALLAGVLVALSANDVAAIPTRRAAPVTLPLKRLAQPQSDLHPLILHQQAHNRAVRRHARMAGRLEPSRRELEARLAKRVEQVEGVAGLAKRFNRTGVKKPHGKRFNRGGVSRLPSFAHRGGKASHSQAGAGGQPAASGSNSAATASSSSSSSAAAAAAAAQDAQSTGLDDTQGITEPLAPTASNSLGLAIEGQDVGYLAVVQVGTPAQNFTILMDSGSADFWIGAEDCENVTDGGGCGNHKFLGTASSSSFVASTNPFQVTYGTGAVSGTIINDDVSIAGLTLNAHTFGVADQETDDFADDSVSFDGLMGLAQSTLSEQQVSTPVESLSQAKLIPATIVSFKISRESDNNNDGEITFGALDTTKFNANALINTPNVNTQGFWEAAMDAVSVNGADLGLTGRTSILDTGTTLIVAPNADASAVHAAIPGAVDAGQGSFTLPCDTNATVALTFANQAFNINPVDIAFQPLNDGSGDCVSGITGSDSFGATEWLVGDVFLKNAYFSVNTDDNTVSLATLT